MAEWIVAFHPAFKSEFDELPDEVQNGLLVAAGLLEDLGPALGRPHVDTLKGSAHANLKELRFRAAHGVWRVAFAFDPVRQAILLVGGDKAGVKEDRFYKALINRAEVRLDAHLKALEEDKK